MIAIAKARGVAVVERHIKPEELSDFSANVSSPARRRKSRRCSEIGPYRFKPGALTETLMNAYADEVRGVTVPA